MSSKSAPRSQLRTRLLLHLVRAEAFGEDLEQWFNQMTEKELDEVWYITGAVYRAARAARWDRLTRAQNRVKAAGPVDSDDDHEGSMRP